MNKLGIGALAATVVLIIFLLLAGVCASLSSYYIYSIGNLGKQELLLNAHTLSTGVAVISIIMALALLLVFFTVAGARNFDFVDAKYAEGWENVSNWTANVRKDFTDQIIKTEKAHHVFIFFSIIVGVLIFFAFTALLALGWTYLTVGQSGVSGSAYNSSRTWSLIAAGAFLLLLLLCAGTMVVFVKGSSASKAGEKELEAGYMGKK